MISTKNITILPDRKRLENICKAISVLDAIMSPEWEYRTYSFSSKWDTDDRCLQMRSGYKGYPLTREMVLSIVDEMEDWGQLEKDILEIDYPFDI